MSRYRRMHACDCESEQLPPEKTLAERHCGQESEQGVRARGLPACLSCASPRAIVCYHMPSDPEKRREQQLKRRCQQYRAVDSEAAREQAAGLTSSQHGSAASSQGDSLSASLPAVVPHAAPIVHAAHDPNPSPSTSQRS